MTRDITSRLSRTDPELTTVLVLSFQRDTDDQPRRIRYLACRGEETMWRIEERQHDADWQTVEIEPLEDLQLNLPEQPNTGRETKSGL
jgi:hypothetical protein